MNKTLSFLESVNFEETPTVGSFSAVNEMNSFDATFESAVEQLQAHNIDFMLDINQLIKRPELMKTFKENALSAIQESCRDRQDPEVYGSYSNMYNQIDRLWDNCTDMLMRESTSVGNLLPLKAIDYPILVKQHLALATKDIMQTEVTNGPVVKKQLEQTWIVDNQTGERWRYPDCFYNEDYKDIYAAGKGLPIKDTPVSLPIYEYSIIENLTDAVVPEREDITINLRISKVMTADGVEIPVNMYINLNTSQWVGGKIDKVVKVTAEDGTVTEVEVKDYLSGGVDFVNDTVSVSSASGQIVSVVFEGYLSNEKNERSVSFDWTREDREWKIEDGHRVNMPFTIESLEDHKALLSIDLYKKTYDQMSKYMTDMEDSQVLDYLDKEFEKNEGLEVDPLQWVSFVRYADFNCDSTIQTTALPSEYIEKELKWLIDRFIIELTNIAKMENMTFVIYGNPKYISLLGKNVNWVLSQGSSTGGIKHNYSYGIMNTGGVKIQVVSALKFDERRRLHKGLRVIPISLNKEQMTFRHYKWTTHIMTPKDSGYKAPDRPGGSYTNLCGVSRYTDASVQGIQGMITFSNAEFLDSTMLSVHQ